MQFQFSNPRLAQISYKALFDDVPLPDETLQVIRQGSFAYFRQMAQAGMAGGTLNPQLDPELAAFLLNAAFTQLGQYLMERFEIRPGQLLTGGAALFQRDEVRRAIDQVISMLEQGLRKP